VSPEFFNGIQEKRTAGIALKNGELGAALPFLLLALERGDAALDLTSRRL
jgi:hypothetical protein